MTTEMTVTIKEVYETIALIEEYLYKGGTGRDNTSLERMKEALDHADRIVIVPGE